MVCRTDRTWRDNFPSGQLRAAACPTDSQKPSDSSRTGTAVPWYELACAFSDSTHIWSSSRIQHRGTDSPWNASGAYGRCSCISSKTFCRTGRTWTVYPNWGVGCGGLSGFPWWRSFSRKCHTRNVEFRRNPPRARWIHLLVGIASSRSLPVFLVLLGECPGAAWIHNPESIFRKQTWTVLLTVRKRNKGNVFRYWLSYIQFIIWKYYMRQIHAVYGITLQVNTIRFKCTK